MKYKAILMGLLATLFFIERGQAASTQVGSCPSIEEVATAFNGVEPIITAHLNFNPALGIEKFHAAEVVQTGSGYSLVCTYAGKGIGGDIPLVAIFSFSKSKNCGIGPDVSKQKCTKSISQCQFYCES